MLHITFFIAISFILLFCGVSVDGIGRYSKVLTDVAIEAPYKIHNPKQ